VLPGQQTFPLSAKSNSGLFVVFPPSEIRWRANDQDKFGGFNRTLHPRSPTLIQMVLINVAIKPRLSECVRQFKHSPAVRRRIVSVAHEHLDCFSRFRHGSFPLSGSTLNNRRDFLDNPFQSGPFEAGIQLHNRVSSFLRIHRLSIHQGLELVDGGILRSLFSPCGLLSEISQSSFSTKWLSAFVENLEVFVVRVNAAVFAPGGFSGNAEFGQVFEGRVLHQKFCYLVHYLIEAVIT
jgi:hypothetical protein